MKTYLLLGIAAVLVSAARDACDACVDGRCLRKNSLPDNTGGLFDINRNTNVYYATTSKSYDDFITQCNLNTLTCNDTANSLDLVDITVDQRTGDLYATGSWRKGIYKVDLVKNERVLLVDEYIQYMTIKDKLYYAPSNSHGIYTYDGGIKQIVPGTEGHEVFSFVVDKNDDIYFEDIKDGTSLMRKLKNGTGTTNYFCGHWNRLLKDKDGNAMVISLTSYAVNRVINGELVEVGAVADWVNDPSFDGENNLIYTVADDPERYYSKQVTDEQCSIVSGNSKHRQITSEPIRTTIPETI